MYTPVNPSFAIKLGARGYKLNGRVIMMKSKYIKAHCWGGSLHVEKIREHLLLYEDKFNSKMFPHSKNVLTSLFN